MDVTDADAVKQSIKLLVLTSFGERVFHPEIGSSVYSSLFENIDPTTILTIQRSIKDVINNYEPRATLIYVNVTEGSDEHSIDIQIYFYINNAPQTPLMVTVNLSRVR